MPSESQPAAAAVTDFVRALAMALAPSTEAVTIADRDGYILWANDEVTRVYRRAKETVIGKHPLTFCPADFSRALSAKIFQTIHSQGKWDGVVMNVDAKGKRFPILLRTVLVALAGQGYVISWAKPFPDKAPFKLSSQQAECFKLLGQGLKPKEIAAQLGITTSSVKQHLNRVKRAISKAQDAADAKSRSKTQIDLPHLAVCCLEAGWNLMMKINTNLRSTTS